MVCEYCGQETHDKFCPIPHVAEPLAGVATSDWIDAVRVLLKEDGATFGPHTREILTDGWVFLHRYVERVTTARLTPPVSPPLSAPPEPPPMVSTKRKKAKH